MKATPRADRRRFIRFGLAAAGAALLAGCDAIAGSPWARNILRAGEWLNMKAQRALLPRDRLASEYSEAEISQVFRANGSQDADDPHYQTLAARNFVDWKLVVNGLVERPAELSLADLRALPARTQITRHDCVEGWSCIGKWKGAPLAAVLERVRLRPEARYLVFYCADMMDGSAYYESIDLIDAFHPQTILAYEMNDKPLPIPHGAPLRLRVERQLGYKMAKYVMRIEAVENFARLGAGKGGFWEDRGYEWYAGI